jgi:hypothetical protein
MKDSDQKYTYEDSPFLVNRRQFLTISGIITAALALPAVWIRTAVRSRTEYIRARAKGLYFDDDNSSVRVSHGNSSVTKMYDEFAGHPLSEISEELFHTTYINRRKI